LQQTYKESTVNETWLFTAYSNTNAPCSGNPITTFDRCWRRHVKSAPADSKAVCRKV